MLSVRRMATRVLTAAAGVLALGSGVLFALRFVPADATPLRSDTMAMATAFTDFAAPGFLAATIAALMALVLTRGRRAHVVLAVLCAAATLAQVIVLAPRWTAAPSASTRNAFTVLALNSRLGNAAPAHLVEAARGADVVVLTEVTAPQEQALTEAGFSAQFLGRSAGTLPRRGAAGTAVFSKFPLAATEALSDRLQHQNWVCTVEVPGVGPVTVVAVHPARPHRGGTRWLREQKELASALPTSGRRLLVGDFNAVASHPTLRALERSGWSSAAEQAGAGWVPTYPANSARIPPLIDIDHVYVSEDLQATHVQTVSVPGTDHLGLLATVGVTAD